MHLIKSQSPSPGASNKFYPALFPKGIDVNGIATTPTATIITLTSPLSSNSSHNSSSGSTKVVKDERRRANHNEVERRRRDNINKWIVELSKVIPDCSNDQSKHGQVRITLNENPKLKKSFIHSIQST